MSLDQFHATLRGRLAEYFGASDPTACENVEVLLRPILDPMFRELDRSTEILESGSEPSPQAARNRAALNTARGDS